MLNRSLDHIFASCRFTSVVLSLWMRLWDGGWNNAFMVCVWRSALNGERLSWLWTISQCVFVCVWWGWGWSTPPLHWFPILCSALIFQVLANSGDGCHGFISSCDNGRSFPSLWWTASCRSCPPLLVSVFASQPLRAAFSSNLRNKGFEGIQVILDFWSAVKWRVCTHDKRQRIENFVTNMEILNLIMANKLIDF